MKGIVASIHAKSNAKINDITKLHNFIYEPTTIRSYRAWNIGSGKIITLDKNMNVSSKIVSLVCVNIASKPALLINSSVQDRSDNVASTVTKDSSTNDENNSKTKLFYCNYEGCISRFLNYGNLLRHIANGNHIERFEKLSIEDFSMITYKSKLDSDQNQELLSLELEKINFNRNNYVHMPSSIQGWTFPFARKVKPLTPKVRQFLYKNSMMVNCMEYDGNQRQSLVR